MAVQSKSAADAAERVEQDKLRRFIGRRHPDYLPKLLHWTFCEETYAGGRDWFQGNIFKYYKEGDDEYRDRLTRAYRFNHTREVVDLIQKYIFKSPVSRNAKDASVALKAFWNSATLAKLDIDQFMRLVSTASSVFGRIWVFVDSNKTADIQTMADQKKAGVGCYAYIVKPQDMLDVGFAKDGSLEWVLVREFVRDDNDPLNSTGEVKAQYRLWTKTSWTLYGVQLINEQGSGAPAATQNQFVDKNGVTVPVMAGIQAEPAIRVYVINSGAISIGQVPCFPVDHVIGDYRYSAPGLIEDIAYLDRATANYLSNLDAIVQDQTFSLLAMPGQAVLPGDDKFDAMKEMGTKRVFLFDGEGGEPAFLSPDVKQASIIVTVINKIINEIYHTIGMGGERTKQDNAVGIDNSSGVAKAYDFERLNSLLTTKSQSLENAEKRLINLVGLWNGEKEYVEDPDHPLVRYADTFDVRSLFDEFTVAERLELIDAPKVLRREQMKQVVEKLFPTLAKDLKAAMLDDLQKNWPMTTSDQLTLQASLSADPTKGFGGKVTKQSKGGSGGAGAGGKSPKKNPATANRQGQVTADT